MDSQSAFSSVYLQALSLRILFIRVNTKTKNKKKQKKSTKQATELYKKSFAAGTHVKF